jgi:hypothetical protein
VRSDRAVPIREVGAPPPPYSPAGGGPLRPVVERPYDEVDHGVAARGGVVVLVADAEEAAAGRVDGMRAVVSEAEHRATGFAGRGVAVVLDLLSVAFLVVEHSPPD